MVALSVNKKAGVDPGDSKQYSAIRVFLRLLAFSKKYIPFYLILCAIITVLALTSTAFAELVQRLVNAATQKDTELLISSAGIAAVILLVSITGNFIKNYLSIYLHNQSKLNLQSAVLQKILNAKMSNLSKYHSGDLINRLDESVDIAQSGINTFAVEILNNILQVVLLLFYLFRLNVHLTAGILVISICVPIVLNFFSKPLRKLYGERQQKISEQQSYMQDIIQNSELVKSFSLVKRVCRELKEKYNQRLKYHFKILWIEVLLFRVHTVIWVIGVLFILGYGGILAVDNKLDVGSVIAFAVSFERVAFPLANIAAMWGKMQNAVSNAGRIFELLDLSAEMLLSDSKNAPDAEPESDEDKLEVKFTNVDFGYTPGEKVLKNLSFTARAGEVTAIVGPSGSGKSTTVNLLLGLYEPSSGSIQFGKDDSDIQKYRSLIGYVSQETCLFSGTIYENIAYGKPNASKEEVITAARVANIHDFIMELPKQYDTSIGEIGNDLSGGQRQRIAIARAVLRNPRIFILDEPTSALDLWNEAVILQELKEMMKDKINIVIAHRLSTIKNADKILFLENGEIAETGTHQELMQRRGKYFEFVKMQNAEATVEGGI
jgi:ABC-type multidrug transport system fused ATPase/permease subunit